MQTRKRAKQQKTKGGEKEKNQRKICKYQQGQLIKEINVLHHHHHMDRDKESLMIRLELIVDFGTPKCLDFYEAEIYLVTKFNRKSIQVKIILISCTRFLNEDLCLGKV